MLLCWQFCLRSYVNSLSIRRLYAWFDCLSSARTVDNADRFGTDWRYWPNRSWCCRRSNVSYTSLALTALSVLCNSVLLVLAALFPTVTDRRNALGLLGHFKKETNANLQNEIKLWFISLHLVKFNSLTCSWTPFFSGIATAVVLRN